VTVHAVVFERVQRVQKFEETLNEFRQTCLMSSMVGGHTEWEVRRVRGLGDWDCAQCCVCQSPNGSESRGNTKRVQTNSFSE